MTRECTAGGQQCTAGGQRGFTLVELMIAMLVGYLLIVLVFAIYTRMSVAYRTQSLLSETQQTLRTAREVIVADIRQTGFMIPAGVMLKDSLAGEPEPPFEVENSRGGTATDAIRIFYADASARARVTTLGNGPGDIGFAQVDDLDQFQTGDVVVVVAMEGTDRSPTDATDIARFTPGCVVEVTGTTVGPPDTVEFGVAAVTYNTATNAHCDGLLNGSGDVLSGAMMYRFVARKYQLDEDKLDEGVLERSPTGGLAGDDFVPLAFGFTDLQVATRYFEAGDGVDADTLGDFERDWYSSETQHDPDPTATRPADAVLTQVSLSLAARTLTAVDTAATAEQPAFLVPDKPVDHNELGDKPAEAATGEHLYRYSTSRVDIRNLGVGR